ncbi:MAG: protein-ADP-ribose hydrolase [Peptococcaceae bacterium]|nr:protein-ADP-ribose hydrolase [Peptococcaceae bacterium]MBQ3119264.1 protein-ADP-ribose hydrolase [Peptococcaceae bacterium]
MTQTKRREYMIRYLLDEELKYKDTEMPDDIQAQKRLLRSLMNVREAKPIGEEFLRVQDDYLQAELAQKEIVSVHDLTPLEPGIYVWQGDITTIACDAIVNAANSAMTGCYYPCHGCIDNAIHSYAGVQLRLACDAIIKAQGHEETTGTAKITEAYNLPCKYVLHTVGPIITGALTKQDEELLVSCYRSCLALAEEYGLKSIAFCCISTGEFRFPNQRAAELAVQTVRQYRAETGSDIDVIFNVFKDLDDMIYRAILE